MDPSLQVWQIGQVLLCCQQPDPMLSGVALLAFNNFGVEDQAPGIWTCLNHVRHGIPRCVRIVHVRSR